MSVNSRWRTFLWLPTHFHYIGYKNILQPNDPDKMPKKYPIEKWTKVLETILHKLQLYSTVWRPVWPEKPAISCLRRDPARLRLIIPRPAHVQWVTQLKIQDAHQASSLVKLVCVDCRRRGSLWNTATFIWCLAQGDKQIESRKTNFVC